MWLTGFFGSFFHGKSVLSPSQTEPTARLICALRFRARTLRFRLCAWRTKWQSKIIRETHKHVTVCWPPGWFQFRHSQQAVAQPWAELRPNSRRAKALVCYQGEAGSNTAIVLRESDASLAGTFSVSFFSSFFFSFFFFLYNVRIKRVREKSLLAFASSVILHHQTWAGKWNFFCFVLFCLRVWFYIGTDGVFHLKILLTNFTWQNKKGSVLLTPLS